MISQITKFYLTNFLKHQTYFFPIIVLFYQANHLTYSEIFLLYSVKSVVFALLEIPSGIIADFVGKNRTNIFARFMVIPALLAFIAADSFWMFLLANLLMNIGDVFKSGTHKAIIFDYLKEHPEIKKSYSQIIGETKVFSRVGEGIASLIGAFVASALGFRAVFVLSLIPAILNFLNALSYEKIKEPYAKRGKIFSFEKHILHLKESLKFLKEHPPLIFLMANSSVIFFSWSVSTIILQPYLVKLGVSLENFGIIYMVLLSVAALASKYSFLIGKAAGEIKAVNYFGWLMIIPFFVLGQKVGIGTFLACFVLINFIKSAYHPLAISEIAGKVDADKRATMLSIAAMFGSAMYLVTLPLIGYILDVSNINTVMIIASAALILNQAAFNFSLWKFKSK